MKENLKIIGLMSGTSFDGVDIAYIETDGLDFIKLIDGKVFAYEERFKITVLDLFRKKDYNSLIRMENDITLAHSKFLSDFLKEKKIKTEDIDLIGFHGQTIFHDPKNFFTCQIGNPWILVKNFKKKVVFDFRRKDICFGGGGAPMAPLYHRAVFGKLSDRICVVNLGGIANATFIKNGKIVDAFDIIGCNSFISHWLARKKYKYNYDKDGCLGLSGNIDYSLANNFFEQEFYTKLSNSKLSMDASDFDSMFVGDDVLLRDGVATIEYVIAAAISDRINAFLKNSNNSKLIFCGGGRLNAAVVKFVEEIIKKDVIISDVIGFDGDLIEAQAFAYLSARVIHGYYISDPCVTGVKSKITGGVVFEP